MPIFIFGKLTQNAPLNKVKYKDTLMMKKCILCCVLCIGVAYGKMWWDVDWDFRVKELKQYGLSYCIASLEQKVYTKEERTDCFKPPYFDVDKGEYVTKGNDKCIVNNRLCPMDFNGDEAGNSKKYVKRTKGWLWDYKFGTGNSKEWGCLVEEYVFFEGIDENIFDEIRAYTNDIKSLKSCLIMYDSPTYHKNIENLLEKYCGNLCREKKSFPRL